MPIVLISLVLVFLVVALLLLSLVVVALLFPASFWGQQAKAVLTWRPPFMRGEALRDWAATTAEQTARNRLTLNRTGETAVQLATELEEGATHAMLPLARQADLSRIVPCPETGQGMVGVTAPEALAIAAHLRKNCLRAEQKRILDMAVENSKRIASRPRGASDLPPLPCPLQGQDHVCCVFSARPLRCRPLHATTVAKGMACRREQLLGLQTEAPEEDRNEQTVAQGVEIGLTRALQSAGLDANIYELNSALAAALETPNAAERWANGENVFEGCHHIASC